VGRRMGVGAAGARRMGVGAKARRGGTATGPGAGSGAAQGTGYSIKQREQTYFPCMGHMAFVCILRHHVERIQVIIDSNLRLCLSLRAIHVPQTSVRRVPDVAESY